MRLPYYAQLNVWSLTETHIFNTGSWFKTTVQRSSLPCYGRNDHSFLIREQPDTFIQKIGLTRSQACLIALCYDCPVIRKYPLKLYLKQQLLIRNQAGPILILPRTIDYTIINTQKQAPTIIYSL